MRVAFATCSWFPDGVEDERPAARTLGADLRVWSDPSVDWEAYDRVVVRSTWDYTLHAQEFLGWCLAVGARRLRNPPDVVAWNADKRYLADLGCATVPTTFLAPGDPLPALAGEVVVKPNVSGGARETGRFSAPLHARALELVERIRDSGRVALVQPYLPAVDAHGETALVFLGGRFSHGLHKQPVLAPDEVAPMLPDGGPAAAMVREDLVRAAEPTPQEIAFGHTVMRELQDRFGPVTYARVDVVRDEADRLVLLELEAIEPRLYLHEAPGAAERLAAAVRAS